MYEFVIPEDVLVTPTRSMVTQPMSFYRFAKMCWFDDARWLTPKSNIKHLLECMKKLDVPIGEKVTLDNSDYDVLRAVIESPQLSQNGIPEHLLLPTTHAACEAFEKVVLEATKV